MRYIGIRGCVYSNLFLISFMSFFKKLFGGDNSENNSGEILTEDEIELCNELGYDLSDARRLKDLSGGDIGEYEFEHAEADDQPLCIYVYADTKRARKIVREMQKDLIAKGKFVYLGAFVASSYMYKVVLININDPYAIMRYAETNGINYGLETEDIITKLKAWDDKYGIEYYGIGNDFLDLKFLAKDIDTKSLASEILEFCPDAEDADDIENKLKKNGELDLWWD